VHDCIARRFSPNIRVLKLIREVSFKDFFFEESFSLINKFYLYFSFLKYLNYIQAFDKVIFKKLVVFSDMQPFDNIFVQYMKINNKVTMTMQHGMYVEFKGDEMGPKENYLYCVSDVFLAWGNNTKRLIEKYHPQCTVYTLGKPVVFIDNLERTNLKYVTIIFDHNLFEEENKKLFLIACKFSKKFNIKVNVRMHPHNIYENYGFEDKMLFFNYPLRGSIFVLGHTSTLLYECIAMNIKSFIIFSDKPNAGFPAEIIFNNLNELENLINTPYDFRIVKDEFFTEYGIKSKELYSNFFMEYK
jgi:hypothetical protein